jgi:hypothetical protein
MPVQPSDQEEEGSHPIAGLFGILISPSVRRGVAKTPTGRIIMRLRALHQQR